MLIDVEIEYLAEILPPRARKPKPVRVTDRHTVTVADVAGADAPVALLYSEELDAQKTAIRAFNGGLWAPYQGDAATLAAKIGSIKTNVRPYARWRADILGDAKAGTLTDAQQRRDAISDAEERAREFVVIDGVIHAPAPEPYFEAWAGRISVKASFIGPTYTTLSKRNEFRADQYAEAVSYAQRGTGGTQTPFIIGSITVLDPSVLRHDPQGAELRKQSDLLVDNIVRAAMGKSALNTPEGVARFTAALLRRLDTDIGWTAHERAAFRRTLLDEMDAPAAA